MIRNHKHFRGCLLGGAIGDALGWPVEFMNMDRIYSVYGKDGITDLKLYEGKAHVTDDTQMTLFTAEGILRSEEKEGWLPSFEVYNAYQRWLVTQGHSADENICNGWLVSVKELHEQRGPGNTCLSALLSRKMGTIDNPANNSKGCGGVMRTAPAGLFYGKETSFDRGAEFAAITHGHPSGFLSAGALSYMISLIVEGEDLIDAVYDTLKKLKTYNDHHECYEKLNQALELSKSSVSDYEAISLIGQGWVGEEALGISVFSSLRHIDDFRKGLISAVNHSGDSDSTGAITGNILGAYLGTDMIPEDWIDKVELKDVIVEVSDGLLKRWRKD